MRYGSWWIILTLPRAGQAYGFIGIDKCTAADTACLNGAAAHPLANWTWIKPPYQGGVTLLGLLPPTANPAPPTELIVDVGGHQLNFDPSTGAFSSSTS